MMCMNSSLRILKASLKNCTVINRNGYNYFIHPIADGIPFIDPDLLEEIADFIVYHGNICEADYIVTAEAMGIPIGTAVSMKTSIPLNIVRKRPYDQPGEVKLAQSTGYSKGELYVNGLSKGDKVVIVDDVISTGGTIIPLVKALKEMGVEILDIIIVIGRGTGCSALINELTFAPKILAKIDVTDKGVEIIEMLYQR